MNKPDVGIEEEIAEIFAWCDSGAAVGFRHRKFAAQTLQALYTRLAEGAEDYLIVTIDHLGDAEIEGLDKAVPLSALKQIFGVQE